MIIIFLSFRITTKTNLLAFDLVLLPVGSSMPLGTHWSLATMDLKNGSVNCYDSSGEDRKPFLMELVRFWEAAHMDRTGSSLNRKPVVNVLKAIPKQRDPIDCGIFICQYAECLSRSAEFNFTHKDMPYFRRRIVWELMSGKLMWL